jgi:hypothetical protein
MPIKAKKPKARKRVVKKTQKGEGIMDLFSGINKLLKKSKLVSTLAPLAGEFGMPISAVAGALGYGHKKKAKPKMRGRGLNQPGGSLSLAGNKHPLR